MSKEYTITNYTYAAAKKYGYKVYPSKKRFKKIDVYDASSNKYIMSIGDNRYDDFPTYLKKYGKEYANERKRLYYARHTADSLGEELAKKLLW